MLPDTSDGFACAGWVVLFWGTRLLYLLFLKPRFNFTNIEELYIGTFGQQLLKGLLFPWIDYRFGDYMGGYFVAGAWASAFFRVLGPTLFALRMVPLTFQTLTLVLWHRTLRRFGTPRMAGYFALLFTFAPPGYIRESLLGLGNHADTVFFSAVSVGCLLSILNRSPRSLSRAALWGIAAGIGLWYSYIYGLTLMACLIYWIHQDRSFYRRRSFWIFLGCFGIAFSPWLYFNLWGNVKGWIVQGNSLMHHGFYSELGRRSIDAWRLLTSCFAPEDVSRLQRRWINAAYFLSYGVLLLAGFLRRRRGKSSGVVSLSFLSVALFIGAIQFSDFRAARYCMPLFPFLFVLVSFALGRLESRRPSSRPVRAGAALGFALLFCMSARTMFSMDQPGLIFSLKGYTYRYVPEALCGSLSSCHRYYQKIAPTLDPMDRFELTTALADAMASLYVKEPLEPSLNEISREPAPLGVDTLYFLGQEILVNNRGDLRQALNVLEPVRYRYPEPYAGLCSGILASFGDQEPKTEDELIPAVIGSDSLSGGLADDYWRALGERSAEYYAGQNPLSMREGLESRLRRLDARAHGPFMEGVGEFLFERWTYHLYFPSDNDEIPNPFPSEEDLWIYRGFGLRYEQDRLSDYFIFDRWINPMDAESLHGIQRTSFAQGVRFFLERMARPGKVLSHV